MSRYIPDTQGDREQMLSAIGLHDTEDLFSDIPGELRFKRRLDLPEGMSELELASHMKMLAGRNVSSDEYACFLGAGAYDHFIPSIVRHIISKPEFYTAYTPYQPEISQGMLQAIFEYQTMICRLTGMDVSNASMYDGPTALTEAALMAVRSTGRKTVLVSKGVHPEYREVLRTYSRFNGTNIVELELNGTVTDAGRLKKMLSGGPENEAEDIAAVIIQSPNFYGYIEDMQQVSELASKNGSLSIACTDPISLALLKPPGECGVDIAAGEGQPLGNPLEFGGPYIGFLAAKKEHVRKIPGRIVGQTTDHQGRRGFTLTLQAREQHIRREKAVSNICSNEALNAVAAAAYLSVMGREGLKETARLCLTKSRYAYERLLETGRFVKVSDAPFFKEFTVKALGESIQSINKRLLEHRIIGGLELERFDSAMKDCWLVAVTEKRTRQEIDAFVKIAAGGDL